MSTNLPAHRDGLPSVKASDALRDMLAKHAAQGRTDNDRRMLDAAIKTGIRQQPRPAFRPRAQWFPDRKAQAENSKRASARERKFEAGVWCDRPRDLEDDDKPYDLTPHAVTITEPGDQP